MVFFNQLRLLLWKNFTVRWRQKIRLAVELIWPQMLFIILVWVRTRGLVVYIPECHMNAKAMPSSGMVPFMQSLVCQYNNTCYEKERQSETAAMVSLFSDAAVTKLTDSVDEMYRNETSRDQIAMLLGNASKVIQLMQEMQLKPMYGIKLKPLIRDDVQLKNSIQNSKIPLSPSTVDALLAATILPSPDAATPSNPIMLIASLRTFNLTAACGAPSLRQQLIVFDSNATESQFWAEACQLTSAQSTQLLNLIGSQISPYAVLTNVAQLPPMTVVSLMSAGLSMYDMAMQLLTSPAGVKLNSSLVAVLQTVSTLASTTGKRLNATASPIELFCGQENDLSQSGLLGPTGGSEDATGFTGTNDGPSDASAPDRINLTSLLVMASQSYNMSTMAKNDSYCATLFGAFNAVSFTRIIMRQLRPLLLGKILFTPHVRPWR